MRILDNRSLTSGTVSRAVRIPKVRLDTLFCCFRRLYHPVDQVRESTYSTIGPDHTIQYYYPWSSNLDIDRPASLYH